MPPPTRPRAEPGYGKAYEHFSYEFVDEFKVWGHVGAERGGRPDEVLLEFVHEFVENRPPTGFHTGAAPLVHPSPPAPYQYFRGALCYNHHLYKKSSYNQPLRSYLTPAGGRPCLGR